MSTLIERATVSELKEYAQPEWPEQVEQRPRMISLNVRDQRTDLAEVLPILAGDMFMVPVVVLIPTRLILDDTPGMVLRAGLWSMAFSLITASVAVFIAWAGGRDAGELGSW